MNKSKGAKVNLKSLSTHKSCPQFSFTGRSTDKSSEVAPGPGKYGAPSITEKYKSSPSFAFGSSKRDVFKDLAGIPGPGNYTPFDPNQSAPKWGFGGGHRLPPTKDKGVPPPGSYKLPGAIESKNVSIKSRPQPKRSSSQPGPGAYMPFHNQTEHAPGRVVMGSEDRSKSNFTKSYSCAPGPGTYKDMKELGGNICTRSCPNFSMQSRRRPPKNETSPGPCLTEYSQF